MGDTLQDFPGNGTFERGVHPPENKNFSSDSAIEIMPAPKKVLLPLLQNLGAPTEAIVKPKAEVKTGDQISKGLGFVSAPLHSPINGKVQKMQTVTLPNGRHMKAISIKAEGEQLEGDALFDDIFGGEWPKNGFSDLDAKSITDAMLNAGLVGLGGAAFPTHVKYIPNEKKPVEAVLINGCECEPFLTCDYRIMVEAADAVVSGAAIAKKVTGAKKVVIGVEDNKPEAINALKKAARGSEVQVAVLHTKYPQGSEKQLIMAIMKKEVPMGGLPLDVGVVVSNVGTITAVARAVLRKKPLTHRVISVTGGGIKNPKNLLVPIGITYQELIDYCGGLTKDAARIVSGGPMMGFAFSDMSAPVTKGASGITVLTKKDVEKAEETNCVRCGRCVDVCPMNLVPTKLGLASRKKAIELLETYNIMGCFECGSCAYICPAQLPLVQLIRTGKAALMASKKK